MASFTRQPAPSPSPSSSSSFSPVTADAPRTRAHCARLTSDSDYDMDADHDSSTRARRPRKRRSRVVAAAAAAPPCRYMPSARRFWADFTLGFSDGLTVPFALTAGLSSLGQTDTVVYAGLAEVSAGCISMGISGYLSARQSVPPPTSVACGSTNTASNHIYERVPTDADTDIEAMRGDYSREKTPATATGTTPPAAAQPGSPVASIARYIAPLGLPADLHQLVVAHVAAQSHTVASLMAVERRAGARRRADGIPDSAEDNPYDMLYDDFDDDDGDDFDDDDNRAGISRDSSTDAVWPVSAGLSVALGYLVGGLLPLWPYFFVTRVGDGLRWSFAVCIVALFLFGFLRDFLLDGACDAPLSAPRKTAPGHLLPWRRDTIPWRCLWKSATEGFQMVVLGGIAAMAAVMCVRIIDDASSST